MCHGADHLDHTLLHLRNRRIQTLRHKATCSSGNTVFNYYLNHCQNFKLFPPSALFEKHKNKSSFWTEYFYNHQLRDWSPSIHIWEFIFHLKKSLKQCDWHRLNLRCLFCQLWTRKHSLQNIFPYLCTHGKHFKLHIFPSCIRKVTRRKKDRLSPRIKWISLCTVMMLPCCCGLPSAV